MPEKLAEKLQQVSVADPDFALRRGPGFNLLAQLAFLPSVISSFLAQNKVEARAPRAPPLDPPLGIWDCIIP